MTAAQQNLRTPREIIAAIPPDVRIIYDGIHIGLFENAGRAVEWLRKCIRVTALDDALWAASDRPLYPPPMDPFTESMMLAISMAERIEMPWIAHPAFKAERDAARDRVRKLEEDIRRAVWPLARIRASGHDMLAAAERVCIRAGIVTDLGHLTDLCRRIALATVPTHARRR